MKTRNLLFMALLVLSSAVATAAPASTAFTYQGRLNDGANPANGRYDLRFTLYNALSAGAQVGPVLITNAVGVTDGLFTVTLDFGEVFIGDARWLEIEVRTNDSSGSFTILSPRTAVTAAPYATFAPSAGTAEMANNVPDSSITEAKLAADAVKQTHLAADAVTSDAIADGSVSDAHISSTGITGDKIIGGDLQALRLKVGQGHGLEGQLSTIAGGRGNTVAVDATLSAIGGGQMNWVESTQSTVAGGQGNVISGNGGFDTIAGGTFNLISDSVWSTTIAGGQDNIAQIGANYSTIAGGLSNVVGGWHSFAAGYRAKANHTGSFVWGDSTDEDVASTGNNQFLIRASGGVGIGTAAPQAALDVAGTVRATAFDGINLVGGSGLSADVFFLGTDTNGNLELGNSMGLGASPFIDFHYGVGSDQDYNVRLMNDANQQLSFFGDYFNVHGTVRANAVETSGELSAGRLKVGAGHTLSGTLSTIAGGSNNTAADDFATVAGGSHNTADYAATVGGGYYNTANGTSAAVGGGSDNTASGSQATVGGGGANTASGQNATVPGGLSARASNFGQQAYAAGQFSNTGDAQTSLFVARNTTTGGFTRELFLNGASQRMRMPSNSVWAFEILVAARSTAYEVAAYRIDGIIENTEGTTYPPVYVVNRLYATDTNWGVSVVADDTDDALVIQVTGHTGDTIRWVASIRTAEVTY